MGEMRGGGCMVGGSSPWPTKAGQNREQALDLVLVFIRGATNLFKIVGRGYFEHVGRTSQPDMQVGCLLVFGMLLRIF